MINPVCGKCGTRPLFENDQAAFAAGWLQMTVGAAGKVIWLCRDHVGNTAEVLEQEGALKFERRITEA